MAARGFVFTIDATFAAFLVMTVLVMASFLGAQEGKNPYLKLNAERAGIDVLAALDESGALDSGNATLINETLGAALPPNYLARLVVDSYYRESAGFNLISIAYYGNDTPNATTTYRVRRDFVTLANGNVVNYSIARMDIWQQ